MKCNAINRSAMLTALAATQLRSVSNVCLSVVLSVCLSVCLSVWSRDVSFLHFIADLQSRLALSSDRVLFQSLM